jgi:GNAT superfamily N-acetyltransferase
VTTNASPQWDDEAVLAASDEWAWVPDFARSVRTDEYVVVAYPEGFLTPTGARLFGSDRDPATLVDEVHAVARDLGRDRLWWTLSDSTRPAGLEAELLTRGAQVVERMDVLALDLTRSLPSFDVGGHVTVRRVTDHAGVRDALEISQSAFGGHEPDDDEVALGLAEIERGLALGDGGRVLALVDGVPAGTGGWGVVGPVCRLWGAGTRPEHRGRGAYRAVLGARLRYAVDAGATLALTHGRVDTSSPILRQLGFRRYGEQRQLVLNL